MGDDKSRALNKLAELPAILPEAEEAWAAVEARGFGPKMTAALRHVATGMTVREAGEAEGFSKFTEIHRHAKACGLQKVRTEGMIELHRSVATLALEKLEEALIDGTSKISAAQLAIIAGISTDKPLKYEERSKDDGRSYMGALEQVAARLSEAGGGSLEIKVTVTPAEPIRTTLAQDVIEDAIDVTPATSGNTTAHESGIVTSPDTKEPKSAPLELGSEPD